jgi:hypothetical protein
VARTTIETEWERIISVRRFDDDSTLDDVAYLDIRDIATDEYVGASISAGDCRRLAMVLGGRELRNLVRLSIDLVTALRWPADLGEENNRENTNIAAMMVAQMEHEANQFVGLMPEDG